MTAQQPQRISDLLFKDGERWFRISEKQLYGLWQGWTHLALMDEKNIVLNVLDQPEARQHTPAPSGCLCDACTQTVQQCRERVKYTLAPEYPIPNDVQCRICSNATTRAATLATQNEFIPIMQRLFEGKCFKQDIGYCITMNVLSCRECFREYLESLRSTAGEQQ